MSIFQVAYAVYENFWLYDITDKIIHEFRRLNFDLNFNLATQTILVVLTLQKKMDKK